MGSASIQVLSIKLCPNILGKLPSTLKQYMKSALKLTLLLSLFISPFVVSANNSENDEQLSTAEELLSQYESINNQQSAELLLEKVEHELDEEELGMSQLDCNEYEVEQGQKPCAN